MNFATKQNSLRTVQYAVRGLAFCALVLLWCASSHSQGSTVEEARKNGLKMLKVVKGQIERTYYDKNSTD